MTRVLSPIDRRQVLARGLAAGVAFAAPAVAQARTRVRLGYLHVVAVDGQIFTGLDLGSFDKQGIDFELVERNTGPEVFEAMARGEVDVASAGGVISNYLALGAGRAFLINDIEVATAQLWVRPDRGVKSFADLRGKRIATTTRTTAHIFLDRALRANGLGFADVQVVSSSMPQAVGAFIAGEVPAVALWVPFNLSVRDKLPDAIKLVDASAFYPQSAVVGGWSRAITTMRRTRMCCSGSSVAGRRRTTTWCAIPGPQRSLSSSGTTRRPRLPTSPRRSRRKRCSRHGNGSGFTPMARL